MKQNKFEQKLKKRLEIGWKSNGIIEDGKRQNNIEEEKCGYCGQPMKRGNSVWSSQLKKRVHKKCLGFLKEKFRS